MIIYMKRYTRADLRANPDVWFVFGDNLDNSGLGGQAAAARGEPNSFGIPTKRSSGLYLTDDDCDREFIRPIWDTAFDNLKYILWKGAVVVWPLDGIGTGLADMPNQCPVLWKNLNERCAEFGIINHREYQAGDYYRENLTFKD